MNRILQVESNSMFSSIDYEKSNTWNFLDKLPDIIEWLKSKGLRAEISRYSRYLNYINEITLSPAKPRKIINPLQVFSDANNSLTEIIEIVRIYEAFKEVNSKGLDERLEKIISGKDFYDGESKDQPRDFLYELLVAEWLYRRGFTIDFDNAADVCASNGTITIHAECKRLKSAAGYEANLRKACKQLHSNYDSSCLSLVFIDIYNCVSEYMRVYEYSDILSMQRTIDIACNEYVYKPCCHITNTIGNRYKETLDGIFFSCFCCLWLSDVTPQYNTCIKGIVNPSCSDEKFQAIKEAIGL